MGRIEQFLAGLVAAVTAAIAPADGEPEPAEPIPTVIPAENPPLPRPRPINEAPPGDGDAAVMMWVGEEPRLVDDILDRLAVEAGAEAELPPAEVEAAPAIVPLPRPNPLATGEIEIAALPEVDFTPRPALQHDAACLAGLAALPIEAALLAPVVGEDACGIATPLMVDEIGIDEFAVALAPTALVDCSVAGAFAEWLEEDVQPAARSILGQWVVGVRVASSYACRGRNNDPNAPLSEHAFGRAIDIAAFQLADGTWVNVRPFEVDTAPEAEFLDAIRTGACGPFTTVLGPGVALHDDHLHLDLATHGANGGLYCP